MPLDDERRALLALHLVPGIGPKLLDALLERFGSALAAVNAAPEDITDVPHIGPQLAMKLWQALKNRNVDAEIELLERHSVQVLTRGGESYPSLLSSVTGAPPLLFVRGQLIPDEKCIGLVGSRTCTSLGKRLAERMARDLAGAGWTVVSGLARGIDGCAHRGALSGGGRTIAVLAGGLSKIYPPEHAELAEAIVASGALVTESCMRMEPLAGLFPARNRIISGLSRGICVIEADEKSGALITARHALEQGREVFVLPGPADGPTWSGNHALLRQGARLVRHARDILDDLEGLPSFGATERAAPPPPLTGMELSIWEGLAEACSVDELAERLNQSVVTLTPLLMQMELAGVIQRLPGNVYERK
ncbi:MAG: DNA-processing protein DprA [Gemmataceae bacterium]